MFKSFKTKTLALLLAVAGGVSVAQAETVTYSLTPDQTSTLSNSNSYISTWTSFRYNDVTWNMIHWNPGNLQIQTGKGSADSQFRFYNTSAFAGRITKVVITFSALTPYSDGSFVLLKFLGGTSEVTATTGGTAGEWNSEAKTLTWTPGASDNFTYFAFYQDGYAASGTNKLAEEDAIVVTYESGSSQPSTHAITIGSHENVNLTFNLTSVSEVEEGTEVVVSATPYNGYVVQSVSVEAAGGTPVAVTRNAGDWSFTMPASDVTVSATAVQKSNYAIVLDNMTIPLIFSPGSYTELKPSYASYNGVTLNGYGGWSFENVLKNNNSYLQMEAGNGKVTLPQIVSSNSYTITVTAVTNSVVVSDGTNSGTNELFVNSPVADITISTGARAAVISQITITPHTLPAPTVSPAGGTYRAIQNVTLNSTTEGAFIYYTLDGTTPTSASQLYTGPIAITESCTLKAVALKDGASSMVTTDSYTILLIEDGVFDFASMNFDYGSGVNPTSDGNHYEPGATTWTAGNVTLVAAGKYRWWNNGTLRFYNNDPASSMTIKAPAGSVLTGITVTGGTAFTASCGSYSDGTWTAGEEGSQTVVLTQNSSTTQEVTKVVVTYEIPTEITITMNAAGIMTYASKYALDFSNVTGLTPYFATDYNTNDLSLTMTPQGQVAAGAGMMLRGTAGTQYTVPVVESAAAVSGNLLVGLTQVTNVAKTQSIDGIEYTTLILANKQSNGINWYVLAEDSYDLKANSAYLRLPSSALIQPASLSMDFGGSNSINAVAAAAVEAQWYTLDGRQLQGRPATKGIYVNNGRKVVIK